MKNEKFIQSIKDNKIKWNRHALERMMERGISRVMVKRILLKGETIESYPKSQPFPSALFLGWINEKPYHIVASFDDETNFIFIITTYNPDLKHFETDYKTRKKL